MRVLSAIDAIEPAWNHARRITFAPRSWRIALKLTAVAFFARIGGCNGSYRSTGGHVPALPPVVSAALAGALAIIIIVGIVIGLVFFYVSSRLQFVLFDSVLRGDSHIAPIWRRYGRATWYWIALKVCFFVVAIVCVAPVLLPMVFQLVRASHAQHTTVNPAHFFVAVFGFLGAMFVVILLLMAVYTLLSDFGLPSMALEGTPLGVTVGRVWRLLRAEPGPVLLYLVMRLVLGIAASIACVIALAVALLVALIPFGAIGAIMWMMFRHAAMTGHILAVVVIGVLGLAYAALVLLAAVMVFGFLQIFFQAYALYFLGGRYPLVGAYLEPYLPQYPPPYGYPPASVPSSPV